MSLEIPARARELAARLAVLFRSDSEVVLRLNDAQRRLRHANDELWSGLRPEALGLVYGDAARVATGESLVARRMTAIAVSAGAGRGDVEKVALAALQRVHWAIHGAFVDYQSACEERRQLAVDVDELTQQLVEELTSVGWSEQAARLADVHKLAAGGPR